MEDSFYTHQSNEQYLHVRRRRVGALYVFRLSLRVRINQSNEQ